MGTLHHVLHTGAKPISVLEFMDAVRATCTSRFPQARGTRHRHVAMAVSGGVDSMALAFLCSQVRKQDPDFKFSDNPVSGFRGMVVNHGLRQGSKEEAFGVYNTLKDMGFYAEMIPLKWSRALGDYSHPKDLPNLESIARTLRYRKLGAMCAFRKIATLLLAHHEDDQYETVLMRLLQGHGSRGLRGMRAVHAIPECEGIFGADRSGWVDDQSGTSPFYNTKPTKKQRKYIRRELRSSIDRLMVEAELEEGAATGLTDVDLEELYQSKRVVSFEPTPIDIEDGGVTVYRPLLGFSKDRLIATCLENNVSWWEDATNEDPTLTMRNAVRHLYKGYTLPKALQKPAILALSQRCEQRAQAQEAEANRLLSRIIIHDFDLHAGTVTVQLPTFEHYPVGMDSRSPLRRRARFLKQREVAAVVMRKVLMLVSPEPHPPLLATLENFVARLFPSLASPEDAAAVSPPRAFTVAGVYLVPIEFNPGSSSERTTSQQQQQQLSWYLSRAPYPSTLPLPRVRTPYWAIKRNRKGKWKPSPHLPWMLWDGRYWVHIQHRFPYRLVVQPFLKEHAKPFRELLPPDDRNRLAALLKRYAPGKVRYTLPGIYLEENLDLELGLDGVVPRVNYPNPLCTDAVYSERNSEGGGDETSLHPKVLDVSKMKLVALPTLDIQIPRLEEWASYEIRYRKVDRDTLRTAGTFHRGSFAPPHLLKMRRVRISRLRRRKWGMRNSGRSFGR
ncbi:adenine nucleotide alpha hydrolases-like protein [Hypoxylon crocopeplum]|nr:adenine nucleotide alpha hydrolases-like protein [Hypoxylon crocopeplum]